MKYEELAEFDSTPEQDHALSIEWSILREAMTPSQLQNAPNTPGALLAQWVKERLLDDVVMQRIHRPNETKMIEAMKSAIQRGDHSTLNAMAAAAGVAMTEPVIRPWQVPTVPRPVFVEQVPSRTDVAPEVVIPEKKGLVDRMKSWIWSTKDSSW